VAPGAHCVAVVEGSDGSFKAIALTFDPDAPVPPAPNATTTPAPPFRNHQTVQIKGLHFAPNAEFSVGECAFARREGACDSVGGSGQVTTAKGSLSTSFQVQRKLSGGGGAPLDCRSADVRCVLEISSEGGAIVDLPLSFKTGGSDAAVAGKRSVNARVPAGCRRVRRVARLEPSWRRLLGAQYP